MIGNDLVDLADSETQGDAIHPRFDERVFTEGERHLVAASNRPSRTRWTLWASKESAYKLLKRLDGATVFSPREFRVGFDALGRPLVNHRSHMVCVTIRCLDSALHAVATLAWSHVSSAVIGVSAATGNPSAAVRSLTRARLAEHLECSADEIAITTGADRIPMMTIRGLSHSGFLSLSHHGSVVAFAWLPGSITKNPDPISQERYD